MQREKVCTVLVLSDSTVVENGSRLESRSDLRPVQVTLRVAERVSLAGEHDRETGLLVDDLRSRRLFGEGVHVRSTHVHLRAHTHAELVARDALVYSFKETRSLSCIGYCIY